MGSVHVLAYTISRGGQEAALALATAVACANGQERQCRRVVQRQLEVLRLRDEV
jgi:hypothetical protein